MILQECLLLQDTLLLLTDFYTFLCTSMTIESPAGEDVDDFANESIWSAFFLNVKKKNAIKDP
jgi:hypothetical protein